MRAKSKDILLWLIFVSGVLYSGCAGQEVKPDPGLNSYMNINYVCPKCHAKVKRETGQPKGFIANCPKCGEKFLTF